jgi:diguanylate cyclase (GGDEF)-like protein
MKNLKREGYKVLFVSFFVFLLLFVISYYFVYRIVINQEIKKANLIANIVYTTKEHMIHSSLLQKVSQKNPFVCMFSYLLKDISKSIKNDNITIRQVSDNYRDPLDKPTFNEKKIIDIYKKNKNLKSYWMKVNEGHNYYILYTKPLKIEKNCLKCHGIPGKDVPKKIYKQLYSVYGNRGFGYRVGDIRGILVVKISYNDVINTINKIFLIIFVFLVLAFLISVYMFKKYDGSIREDLKKMIDYLENFPKKKKFKPLNEKFEFEEFEKLRKIVNETIETIKNFQKEILEKTYFYSITGLPNKIKLYEDLKNGNYSLILFDIDGFKEINAIFGIEKANKIIKCVAERFKKFTDLVYQIDIDEFVVLFPKDSKENIYKKAKEILEEIEKPYKFEDIDVVLKFKVGISLRGELSRAIMAVDACRQFGKDITFHRDIEHLLNKYRGDLKWLKEIKEAIKNDRIVPFYQPIVDKNEKIVKYEALVRLIDSNGKVVSPYFFLEISKRYRYYYDITKIMITKALEKFKNLKYGISLNLSLADLENDEMREFIIKKVKEFPQPQRITFEIVESEEIKEDERITEFLKELKKLGVSIYIDDFGSGYANFAYLLNLHVDGIKIDGTLVKDVLIDKNSELIINIIVFFAKKTNKTIVSEYVENKEIFEKLKEMGVEYFQGYYFSPPKKEITEE